MMCFCLHQPARLERILEPIEGVDNVRPIAFVFRYLGMPVGEP